MRYDCGKDNMAPDLYQTDVWHAFIKFIPYVRYVFVFYKLYLMNDLLKLLMMYTIKLRINV